jgi:hypothetical protein
MEQLMQEIELKLTTDEANFVLAVLGNLPTQSNAWPLMQKIKTQADAQVQAHADQDVVK